MTKEILVALLVLVVLGPALLAYILRRRRNPGLRFWRGYLAMVPGFLACALLKAGYHLTGWFPLEVAAPVAMVVGVLLAVRRLER